MRSVFVTVFSFFLVSLIPVQAHAAPELSISPDYILVTERVRRNTTTLRYRGVVTNSGDQTALGARAFVTSSDPNVQVRDNRLRIGNIGSGITQTTTDTFRLRIPNGYPLDLSVLSWTFEFRRAINNDPPIAEEVFRN